MMKSKLKHYYPCGGPVDKHGFAKTACGRDGYKLRSDLFARCFKTSGKNNRCKACSKRFEKDQIKLQTL